MGGRHDRARAVPLRLHLRLRDRGAGHGHCGAGLDFPPLGGGTPRGLRRRPRSRSTRIVFATVAVFVPAGYPLWYEGFEFGPGSLDVDGLWHVTDGLQGARGGPRRRTCALLRRGRETAITTRATPAARPRGPRARPERRQYAGLAVLQFLAGYRRQQRVRHRHGRSLRGRRGLRDTGAKTISRPGGVVLNGRSGAWQPLYVDLSDYAGSAVRGAVCFRYGGRFCQQFLGLLRG